MNAWSWLVSRLATREPATPLALFRISVGLVVAVTFTNALLTNAINPIWVRLEEGGYRAINASHWLIAGLGGATVGVVHGLAVVALLGGLITALGLGGRWPALLTLQVCNALFSLDHGTGGGHDKLITNALWLLFLSPSTTTLSLDCYRRRRSWTDETPVPIWTRYLAVFQLAVVYGFTGAQKVGGEWFPWGNYEALYDALLLPSWRKWGVEWVGWVFPLTQVGTAVAWWWELSWPLVLLAFWFRSTRERGGWLRSTFNRLDLRSLYIGLGVLFHLSLWVLMELGPFSWITMSFYWCAFHHDELQRAWSRLRTLGGSGAMLSVPHPAQMRRHLLPEGQGENPTTPPINTSAARHWFPSWRDQVDLRALVPPIVPPSGAALRWGLSLFRLLWRLHGRGSIWSRVSLCFYGSLR